MTITELLESTWNLAELIAEAEDRAESLKDRCTKVTASLSGMPGGGGEGKAQDMWAGYADARAHVQELRKTLSERQLEINRLIWKLKDDWQYNVLFRRYVQMQSWKQIMYETGYSRTQLNRFRTAAIRNLQEVWRHD